MLTQKQLKEILHYDPETGIFTWLVSPAYNIKAGRIAGGKNNTNSYVYIKIKRQLFSVHRLAHLYMTGTWPKDQVDHVDHIRDNNKWRNLREVTRTENHKNHTLNINNSSGVAGVRWAPER